MPEQNLSRRQLLAAAGIGAAGLGVASLSAAGVLGERAINAFPTFTLDPTATPNTSPAQSGPYVVNRLILGEDAGTLGLEQPIPPSVLNVNYWECIEGQEQNMPAPPSRVNAAVYYPVYSLTGVRDHRVPTPNPLNLTKGPYPVLLYAHGFRPSDNACRAAFPINRDFTTIDFMLRHVASYGIVCVAPNLSWARSAIGGNPALNYSDIGAYGIRAKVLMFYWLYLANQLNTSLFAQQLDLSRLILAGHSTGAGGATLAGRELSKIVSFSSIAYGLVAPVSQTTIPLNSAAVRNLLVLGGTVDTLQGANPQDAYMTAATPKTLVTIPGANHFGYTDLCDGANVCQPYGVSDPAGTIARADQQLAGAAYLAALARYYALGDKTARPYLTGERAVGGLEALSIQVQQEGYRLPQPIGTLKAPTFEPVGP